jgi:RTX calcium-binding nonapeptide repeat (4 copies)
MRFVPTIYCWRKSMRRTTLVAAGWGSNIPSTESYMTISKGSKMKGIKILRLVLFSALLLVFVAGIASADTVKCSSGNSKNVSYPCEGTEGNDTIYGDEHRNEIYGRSGDDKIYGRSAYDSLNGGEGSDQIVGGRGGDYIDAHDNLPTGGNYNDIVYGSAGNDYIYAADRNRDFIDCGKGDDTVDADFYDEVQRNCERTRLYQ